MGGGEGVGSAFPAEGGRLRLIPVVAEPHILWREREGWRMEKWLRFWKIENVFFFFFFFFLLFLLVPCHHPLCLVRAEVKEGKEKKIIFLWITRSPLWSHVPPLWPTTGGLDNKKKLGMKMCSFLLFIKKISEVYNQLSNVFINYAR